MTGGIVSGFERNNTKEEEKYLRRNWKSPKKEHEAFIESELEKAKQKQ